MMLRRNGTESLFRERRGQDWNDGSAKPMRFTATEAVLGRIEQAIQIVWPVEIR